MSDIQKVDISTPEGRRNAIQWLDKNGWMLFPFTSYWLVWKAGKFLFNSAKSLTSETVQKEIEEQRETAIKIIQAGKKNDVDELEITMSEKAGLSLGSSVEGFPVEVVAGTSGKMTLKVKYK